MSTYRDSEKITPDNLGYLDFDDASATIQSDHEDNRSVILYWDSTIKSTDYTYLVLFKSEPITNGIQSVYPEQEFTVDNKLEYFTDEISDWGTVTTSTLPTRTSASTFSSTKTLTDVDVNNYGRIGLEVNVLIEGDDGDDENWYMFKIEDHLSFRGIVFKDGGEKYMNDDLNYRIDDAYLIKF